MVNSNNPKNDNSSYNEKSFATDNDIVGTTSSSATRQPKKTTSSQQDQLQLAMNAADTIRLYENELSHENKSGNKTVSGNNDYFKFGQLVSKVQIFWETPGIQAGCVTAVCCIIPIIPLRRSLLHLMTHHWKLGSSFPDLLITPTLAMLVAQCSVYVGTCYGVVHYLDKVSSISKSSISPTVNAICNDPIFIDASNVVIPPATEEQTQMFSMKTVATPSSMSSIFRQYDIRDKVTTALYKTVRSCDERREYNRVDVIDRSKLRH